METYARKMKLKIQFNTKVDKISKAENGQFRLGSGDKTYCSEYLLVGTGLQKANGMEGKVIGGNIETYNNASTNRDDYEGQRVLILGRGNAAFEFAQNIMAATQYVHMLSRPGRLKLAWESHYPGGVRTIHNTILETYLLKSMDLLWEEDWDSLTLEKKDDLWYTFTVDEGEGGRKEVSEPSEDGYHRVISCLGWIFDRSLFDTTAMPEATRRSNYEAKFPLLNE